MTDFTNETGTTIAAPRRILRVDASMRSNGSVSRQLTDKLVERLSENKGAAQPAAEVVNRDLASDAPTFINETWIGANFTPADDRTEEQKAVLGTSDALIEELKAADILVIGLPIYNFGPPAALKAWIDLIARAGVTFRYTENGPVGLLEGKKAYIVVASGGTQAGSEIDFASTYMRHVLGFIGITDVEIIAADKMMQTPESFDAAVEKLEQIAA